ncbi:MarR family winged helix-turn-helix transcriptional regulator [Desulfoferula mesophila]|uniref:Transcriptional regulator n=1 Tax=Desulfoferula mesophila TaxID=3058419 RepID=A0AAU9EN21_9BACT|nr:transcriptional regulator [Desulfoferula mesophilus]
MAKSSDIKSKDSIPGLPTAFDLENGVNLARNCVAYNLRRAARLVSQAYDQALKPIGLKVTQFSLLASFAMAPDSKISELADWLGMDRTTLSRNLRVLEKRGLIELTQGQDRREVNVRITEEGMRTFKKALPYWARAQKEVVGNIGQDSWSSLAKELRSLVAGLK